MARRCRKRLENSESTDAPKKKRSKRSSKKVLLEYIDEQGNCVALKPQNTLWYLWYYMSPDVTKPKFHKKFRRRFRMPHAQYLELLEEMEASTHFARWKTGHTDCVGVAVSPLPLLLLGALRYLGRGWTFDCIEEATAISEETHRQFFHRFIEYGSTILFDRYVVTPTTAEQAAPHMHEMNLAGFHGCCGSADATHVMMERCCHRLKQQHQGPKLNLPSRTYNITVNHRRRILYTTTGHPARWNDKTIQLFDRFMMGIHKGSHLGDVEFELYDTNSEGNRISVRYRGGWLIVDNGYLHWSIAMPPYKNAPDRPSIRWSEWLESLRKDVECVFGILKGRWRILKTSIRLQGIDKVDMCWKTCCALHNWLLEIDGLDEKWIEGVSSDWEGDLGNFDSAEDVQENIPFALRRLHGTQPLRNYDASGMGPGNDRFEDSPDYEEEPEQEHGRLGVGLIDEAGAIVVRHLSFDKFRDKLVKHFDILFQNNQLQWPSRHGRFAPPR
jgi:hypothetical protein